MVLDKSVSERRKAEGRTASRGQEAPGGLWDSVKKAAFVIGSGILFLAAFGNSLTWHLQKFWGASGDFWQNLWTKVYVAFEGHDAALFFLGTMLAPTLAFWGCNLLLLVVDTTGKPSFITRYRIQEDKNNPVDPVKLRQAVKTVLFNHVFISGPMVVIVYLLMSWRGDPCGPELPTFHWALMELAVFSMLEELLFYYSHRLFHHPSLYKHFHKQHHEWTAPIGLVSIYAHPLEHVISNTLPVVIGPVILGSHISSTCMWYCLALVSTTISHCGYHLPFLPSPSFMTSIISGSTSALGFSVFWTGSTALTLNSERPSSTNVTFFSPASPLSPRASPTHPKRANNGLLTF